MREEKFICPDVDCGFISFDNGDCPQCGTSLEKIKGDDYVPMKDESEAEGETGPASEEFSDDPDDISWYPEGESYSTL